MWTAARERILAPLTATAPARGAQRPRSSALRTCCDRDAARASDSAANRATSSSIDCGSCRGCGFCCGFYSGDAASRHHSCATMRPWVPEEGVRTHPREVAGTAPPSTADRATGQRQAGQAPAVTVVRAIHLRASEACRAADDDGSERHACRTGDRPEFTTRTWLHLTLLHGERNADTPKTGPKALATCARTRRLGAAGELTHMAEATPIPAEVRTV